METCGLIITLERRDLNRAAWKWLWRAVRIANREADKKFSPAIRHMLVFGTGVTSW